MTEDKYTRMMEKLAQLEERISNIGKLLENFIESAEKQYLSKQSFEAWKSNEFSPLKTRAEDMDKLKWYTVSAVIVGIVGIALNLLRT